MLEKMFSFLRRKRSKPPPRKPSIWTYDDCVRIAQFYLDYKVGSVPTLEEVAQALPHVVAKDPTTFKEAVYMVETIARSSYTDDTDGQCLGDYFYRDLRGIPRKGRPLTKEEFRERGIFLRLGERQKAESPRMFLMCNNLLDWEHRKEGQTVDWKKIAQLCRDEIGPLILYDWAVIERFYEFDAPFEVFELLLKAKPHVFGGRELRYVGSGDYRFDCQGTVELSPERPPRADVYELLLKHGAAAQGQMLVHSVNHDSLESTRTVLSLAICDQETLDRALRFNLERHILKEDWLPIVLVLLRHGADPTRKIVETRIISQRGFKSSEEVVKIVKWESAMQKLEKYMDGPSTDRCYAPATKLWKVVRTSQLMMTLCSALVRVGRESTLRVLPEEMFRCFRVMLA